MPSREKYYQRKAAGVCTHCAEPKLLPGYLRCEHCETVRQAYRVRRQASGLCMWDGCPTLATRSQGSGTRNYKYCETHGRAETKRRRDRETAMVVSPQDLAFAPKISFGLSPGGLRYFSCWLPWPACTKHNRTALTARPGFRPLVRAAKEYQQFLVRAVIIADFPILPWLREGSEFELDVITFGHKSDGDQYTGGLQDDFTKTGVWANDKALACTHSRRLFIPKTEEKRLYVAAYETEKVS